MISQGIDIIYTILHTIKSFIGVLKIFVFSIIFRTKIFKVKKYKFKENFFILGSGESNKEIDKEEIKYNLMNSTSIGINFWIYHDYVPDLYFFEINGSDTYTWNLFCELLQIKKREYQNTIFIIRDVEKLKFQDLYAIENFPEELRKNLYFSLDFDLGKGTMTRFNMTTFVAKKFFNFINILPKSRGSLSSAFSIGLHSSSKNIVLVGCDLTGSNYHLARDFISNKYFNLPKIKTIRQENPEKHKTNDKNYGLPLISDVILAFQLHNKNNKNIFNIDKKGYFSKHFEKWDSNFGA